MLPRENRLTRMKDYEILFAEGRFVGGALVTAKVWQIEPAKYPRRNYALTDLKIGFLVNKKVSKRAVDRNRLKRQLREIVRLQLLAGQVQPGFMIAIIAKPESLGKTSAELEADVLPLLRRARVMAPLRGRS